MGKTIMIKSRELFGLLSLKSFAACANFIGQEENSPRRTQKENSK